MKQQQIEVSFEWQTSRGASAATFKDEEKAREWKLKQIKQHSDRLPNTKLVRVTVTKVVEEV